MAREELAATLGDVITNTAVQAYTQAKTCATDLAQFEDGQPDATAAAAVQAAITAGNYPAP